jgi:hypothetical protein
MSTTRSLRRRRPIVIGLAACALLATAGVAYGIGTSTSTTVIHACYKTAAPNTLSLRTASTCPAGTTALSWKQQGPQGIQGAQGMRGVQGTQGVQGPAGVSGFQTASGVTGTIPAGDLGGIDVPCPAGETAISGGYTVPYTATVLDSHARTDDPGTWTVTAAFPSTSGTITAYAQCAQVTTGAAVRASRARTKVTITPLRR